MNPFHLKLVTACSISQRTKMLLTFFKSKKNNNKKTSLKVKKEAFLQNLLGVCKGIHCQT